MLKTICAATALLAAGIATASAHMTLERGEAAVGSTYKAVFRVPHGCGGKPTNVVRVRIPDGVIAVKPMPKARWTLEKIRGAYDTTYEYHGSQVSEGVREVVWSGGNLLDDEYDEFVLRGFLTPGLPWARRSISLPSRSARTAPRRAGSKSRPRARTPTSSMARPRA